MTNNILNIVITDEKKLTMGYKNTAYYRSIFTPEIINNYERITQLSRFQTLGWVFPTYKTTKNKTIN